MGTRRSVATLRSWVVLSSRGFFFLLPPGNDSSPCQRGEGKRIRNRPHAGARRDRARQRRTRCKKGNTRRPVFRRVESAAGLNVLRSLHGIVGVEASKTYVRGCGRACGCVGRNGRRHRRSMTLRFVDFKKMGDEVPRRGDGMGGGRDSRRQMAPPKSHAPGVWTEGQKPSDPTREMDAGSGGAKVHDQWTASEDAGTRRDGGGFFPSQSPPRLARLGRWTRFPCRGR